MAKVTINKDICKGCGLCVTVCPKQIIILSENSINDKGYNPAEITDMNECIGCANCAKLCPDYVFTVER